MSDHQSEESTPDGAGPHSIPTDFDVVLYVRAIGDFRNDRSNQVAAYLAAVVDAALLFVNPSGAMCPELDLEAHAEFWALGAGIWVQILDLFHAGEEITYEEVLRIVHDRCECEFGDPDEPARLLASTNDDDAFRALVHREFGEKVPTASNVRKDVLEIVSLIAGPAMSLAQRWGR